MFRTLESIAKRLVAPAAPAAPAERRELADAEVEAVTGGTMYEGSYWPNRIYFS